MGEIIKFRNKDDGTLDKKWSSIIRSMDNSLMDDAIAIRVDKDGNIDLHHSAPIDPYTLIGLLEVFKIKLINN